MASTQFTEYRFSPDFIAARVEERAGALRANRGFSDLLGFGLKIVMERLRRDRRRYCDYGPYWWALKEALNAAGHALGEQSDAPVCRAYRGETAVETLVMADEFRTEYLKTHMVYSNRFILDGEKGAWYTLYDEDMEKPGI